MAGDEDTREAALPGGPRSESGGGAPPLQDLCGSCEKSRSCTLPRPEGGVWHCASYAWSERGGSDPGPRVTTCEAWTMSEIDTIIDRHRGERGELIAILEEIQGKYSYLPEESLRAVAEKTGRSLVDIYGVATFYRWFSLKPRGKHLLTCCMGTACHVRGAPRIDEELRRQLDAGVGETTEDREITYETQNCLGGCALGPIVVVDGHYFSNVTPGAVAGIIETDPGRSRQRRREDRRPHLPGRGELRALQSQPDGRDPAHRRAPVHPGHDFLRGEARSAAPVRPLRLLHDQVRARRSRPIPSSISSARTATRISPAPATAPTAGRPRSR